MAEKIKLFQLDIDVDGAISASKELKKESAGLKAQLDELKKAGKENSREFVELEAQYKKVRSEYNSSQRQLGNLINLQGKNIKSIEQGRAALSVVSKEWAKQADLYGENSQAAEKLAKKKTELTARLKELESQTGDNRRNVGNYSQGVREALGIDQAYTAATEKLTTAKKLYAVAVGQSTGAMKMFRLALASTGIGLLIIALGSLISYFASTQEGINKVRKVLIPLKTIFESLFGVIQNLGKRMVDAFSNPEQAVKDLWEAIKENLVNRIEGLGLVFKSIGKIISSGFREGYGELADSIAQTTTGVEDFTNKVKKAASDTGKFLSDAAARGAEMENIRQNLKSTEDDFIKQQAKLKRTFEEQKKLAEDQTKSQQVREKAAQDAIKSQEDLKALTVDRLEQEARLIELKQKSNDTSDDEKTELARKMAEIDNAIAEEAAKTTEAQNKLNSIRKEGYEKARELRQKALEDAISKKEQELALFVEQNRLQAQTIEERLQLQREAAEKEKEILTAKLEAKKISELQYQTEILKIDNELKEAKAEQEAAELERIKTFEDKKRSLQEEIRLANQESELARQELKAEMDFEKHAAELEQLQLREEEKIELLALLETQKEQVLSDIRTSFEEQRLDKFKAAMEQDIAIREKNAQQAASVATQLTGILTGLLGDSLAAKLASIAVDAAIQAGLVSITTASSQAQNLANATMVAPPPANLPFIAMAGAQNLSMQAQSSAAITKILASAALQGVGTLVKGAKKMETGGLIEIGGKRHSAGGTKFIGEDGTTFEAEQGELIGVLNRKAAAMVQGLNDAYPINGAMRSDNYFAAGGFVKRASQPMNVNNMAIDYDLLAVKLAQANMALPAPVVAVEEINSGQGRYASVVNGANI